MADDTRVPEDTISDLLQDIYDVPQGTAWSDAFVLTEHLNNNGFHIVTTEWLTRAVRALVETTGSVE